MLESFDAALQARQQTHYKEKTFDGRVEAQLIALRCSDVPEGYQKWSLRLLAETLAENGTVASISHEKCALDAKKNELKPWQVKEWLIPTADAEYICAMEAVLDVYERPYDEENPVVGLDESPQQLVSEVRAGFTDAHGVQYQDFEYKREGVADLYMMCEPLQGRREIFVKENHSRLNGAEVVRVMAEDMYPQSQKIMIVQDNLSAHKPSALYEIIELLRCLESTGVVVP